ncbi:type II secretion system protein GspM [Pararhodobacter sp. SW119]|uniref:type II secretion system protein GspM n=1 Tax=Pararhodobacter sp. SW119 TaxID=2780075 RepID=UPI001ADFD31A
MELISRQSIRARLLLICLGGFMLSTFFLLGIILPVAERREAAYRDLAEVQAERAWLEQMRVEHARLSQRVKDSTELKTGGVGLSGIETSLLVSGLWESVTELGNAAEDSIDLRFNEVDFVHLMSWLNRIELDAGYTVSRLQLTKGEHSGKVEAEMQLKQAIE